MNRLAQTLSPYLLQHANNPVFWQPWDSRALAQAKREDKPILLSIGYAACHWCHVMERESFMDEETAALMNAHFVNIKVDREERPDLDKIYQSAHYLFRQGAGGWPLTMFLSPAGAPFFGGTYFPKTARPGLTAFSQVLERVAAAWKERRKDIAAQNEKVMAALRQLDQTALAAPRLPPADVGAQAAEKFSDLFDAENGGLGGSPKFPHPVELAFCLQTAARRNDKKLLRLTLSSLQKMSDSGLADHLGGGFFRYCVDAGWRVPHFEKMLCDNGLLLALLADAQTLAPQLQSAANATANWLMTEMTDAGGGFYASQDADTDAGEGGFYLWTKDELARLLSAQEYAVFASHFGVDAAAEVEGKIHLARRQTAEQTAAACSLPQAQSDAALASAGKKLTQARAKRQKPATDDKILTAWNALAIAGLARGGRRMRRADWLARARRAFFAVYKSGGGKGRLPASVRGGQASRGGFLDDYAFMLNAALELLRGRFEAPVFAAAGALAANLLEQFEDKEGGGFFFNANDDEKLIRRIKAADDGATPSGNGVAARALMLLGWLGGEAKWLNAADRALRAFYPMATAAPGGCVSLLAALQWHNRPPALAFLRGDSALCQQWQQRAEAELLPDALVFCLPSDVSALPAALQKTSPKSGALAHICHGNACLPPADNFDDFLRALKEPPAGS